MLYTSIDIETTGNNPEEHQVLQIGAIVIDTDKFPDDISDDKQWDLFVEQSPQFETCIKHDVYVGNAVALAMNADILERLSYYERNNTPKKDLPPNVMSEQDAVIAFKDFLYDAYDQHEQYFTRYPNGGKRLKSIVALGKNFSSFDKQFLTRMKLFNKHIRFGSRTFDPSVFYLDEQDDFPPSLPECMKRSGLFDNEDNQVAHTGLKDAIDTARLFEYGRRERCIT